MDRIGVNSRYPPTYVREKATRPESGQCEARANSARALGPSTKLCRPTRRRELVVAWRCSTAGGISVCGVDATVSSATSSKQ